MREPLDQRNREERILQSDPKQTGLNDYMASLDRTNQALGDLKNTNLRSNQQAIAELNDLLATGTGRLQDEFKDALLGHTRPVEPLHFLTKQLSFPEIPQEDASRLRTIHSHIVQSLAQTQADAREAPTVKIYADLRGEYITNSLRNLASASVSTARKTTVDAIYRQGTNGIGTYASGMDGIYTAEYGNICLVFPREDWSAAVMATCRSSLAEFRKTLVELNNHVKQNLVTDCFLGYEIVDIATRLAIRLESSVDTKIKDEILQALGPVRETAKRSVNLLYEEPRMKVQTLVSMPFDGAAVPITQETMMRLQTMTAYLQPLASILASVGPGGWGAKSAAGSSASLPFDVGADGRQLFANYAGALLDSYVTALDQRSSTMLKNKSVQGVFLLNNVAVIDRMVRNSDLAGLLTGLGPKMDAWRKKGVKAYMGQWIELSQNLMEVQHTSRARPASGSGPADSAAIVKGLSGKEKDAIKEGFKAFTANFNTLLEKHKTFRMEVEVRSALAKEVHKVVEPLYARFWDRYHEIDKGKGKYVQYDKGGLAAALAALG